MATAFGVMGRFADCGSEPASSIRLRKKKDGGSRNAGGFKLFCLSSSLTDHYQTLRIHPGASESQVKTAFRHLALQYHPDVYRGSDNGVKFHQIVEAYDMVMTNLKSEMRGEVEATQHRKSMVDEEEDTYWEEPWEEWMGWEGAAPPHDYSSQV
ncbi:unnamed protein product [Cuscuta epithymum]|uniref:J domain-containing protein n=1 Tax=Cuscuta epithymum TaxID=186058 RepID=A0AAV0DZ33_9ASTE|nr:unnamed protein product [Cuscuta epithymum]